MGSPDAAPRKCPGLLIESATWLVVPYGPFPILKTPSTKDSRLQGDGQDGKHSPEVHAGVQGRGGTVCDLLRAAGRRGGQELGNRRGNVGKLGGEGTRERSSNRTGAERFGTGRVAAVA